MTDESYLEGFADWANDILERCPQAIAVLPDVIDGTEEDNARLVCETMTMFPQDRVMPIWHMHESIGYLLHLCADFGYVGIGSSREYFKFQSPKWRARIAEVFAAIDAWERESDGAYIRPRIHMMRAQSMAHLYAFDSSDSTNVAINHNRQRRKSGEGIKQFAKRIDDKIQASAGAEAEHQIKRPLLEHLDQAASEAARELDYAKHILSGGTWHPNLIKAAIEICQAAGFTVVDEELAEAPQALDLAA